MYSSSGCGYRSSVAAQKKSGKKSRSRSRGKPYKGRRYATSSSSVSTVKKRRPQTPKRKLSSKKYGSIKRRNSKKMMDDEDEFYDAADGMTSGVDSDAESAVDHLPVSQQQRASSAGFFAPVVGVMEEDQKPSQLTSIARRLLPYLTSRGSVLAIGFLLGQLLPYTFLKQMGSDAMDGVKNMNVSEWPQKVSERAQGVFSDAKNFPSAVSEKVKSWWSGTPSGDKK